MSEGVDNQEPLLDSEKFISALNAALANGENRVQIAQRFRKSNQNLSCLVRSLVSVGSLEPEVLDHFPYVSSTKRKKPHS